jgi:NAD-dependent dihydropyrimidine dehydrogenase PreA subunit
MSKTWYPVINYENCIGCGACFNKCSHGVYEMKDDKPKVVQPQNCVEKCRGCQNLCPAQAIDYVGDTGDESSCSCGCCS